MYLFFSHDYTLTYIKEETMGHRLERLKCMTSEFLVGKPLRMYNCVMMFPILLISWGWIKKQNTESYLKEPVGLVISRTHNTTHEPQGKFYVFVQA